MGMRQFGGGKKNEKPADPQEALNNVVRKLKDTLSNVEQRQKVLEAKARSELENAKEKNRQKDKRAALYSLKKKKMYEAEVDKLYVDKMNLEQQIFSIQNDIFRVAVLGIRSKRRCTPGEEEAPVKIRHMIDRAVQLREDIEAPSEFDSTDDEISEALTRSIGNLANVDDDELLAELDEMVKNEAEHEMMSRNSGEFRAAKGTGACAEGPRCSCRGISLQHLAFSSTPQADKQEERRKASLVPANNPGNSTSALASKSRLEDLMRQMLE